MAPKLPTASNKGHALLWALMRWFFLLMVAWLSLTWADLDPFHHVADVLDANAQLSNETTMQIEERAGHLVHEIPCRPDGLWGGFPVLLCEAVCSPFVGHCRKAESTGHGWSSTTAHRCQCSFEIAEAQEDSCRDGYNDNCHALCLHMSFIGGYCSFLDMDFRPVGSHCKCIVNHGYVNGRVPLDEAIDYAHGVTLCSPRSTDDASAPAYCDRACPNGVTGHCISHRGRGYDSVSIQTCMCEVPSGRGPDLRRVSLSEANRLYPPSSRRNQGGHETHGRDSARSWELHDQDYDELDDDERINSGPCMDPRARLPRLNAACRQACSMAGPRITSGRCRLTQSNVIVDLRLCFCQLPFDRTSRAPSLMMTLAATQEHFAEFRRLG